MSNRYTHYILAGTIALLVLIFGGSIAYQEWLLQSGTTTILKTRPVDPRDLFRGEYVVLSYEFELEPKVKDILDTMKAGDPIYIQFAENAEGVAYVVSAQTKKPISLNGLWLHGEKSERRNRIDIPNLAQFYVPEGSGRAIEMLRSDLHVEVAIKNGQARIVQLRDKYLSPIDPADYIKEQEGQFPNL
jgi:uncharacterized membrane-anchored protein